MNPYKITPSPSASPISCAPLPLYISLPLAALSGLVLSLPFTIWECSSTVWFALAPLFWLSVNASNKRHAALIAAVFSWLWFGSALSFLWDVALAGAIPATLYSGLFYVAGMLCVRRFAKWGLSNAIIGTAALFVLIEILRSVIPVLFFPWVLLGHTLATNAHLRQSADLFGVYGLSFIIAGINACLAFALPALLPKQWKNWQVIADCKFKSAWKISWLFLLVGVGGAWSYGELRIEKLTPRLKEGDVIAVLQGNVATKLDRSEEQWDAQMLQHAELHNKIVTQSRAVGTPAVLVCWAETMVPSIFYHGRWSDQFLEQVRKSGTMTLTGASYREPSKPKSPEQESSSATVVSESKSKWGEDLSDHNAALVFDEKGQELARYFKRRLVPFGEYIPYADRFSFLRILRSVTQDQYLPGTEPSPIFSAGNYHIGLNLCVEDVHPDLARESAWAGADALINLTNDGWFYGTFGPLAHMRAAMWRAVEVRRPMLRVTNTGRTVAVDPLGEVSLLVPQETEGTALVRLWQITPNMQSLNATQGAINGGNNGLVTLYMRLGESGVFLLAMTVLLACWVLRIRPNRAGDKI